MPAPEFAHPRACIDEDDEELQQPTSPAIVGGNCRSPEWHPLSVEASACAPAVGRLCRRAASRDVVVLRLREEPWVGNCCREVGAPLCLCRRRRPCRGRPQVRAQPGASRTSGGGVRPRPAEKVAQRRRALRTRSRAGRPDCGRRPWRCLAVCRRCRWQSCGGWKLSLAPKGAADTAVHQADGHGRSSNIKIWDDPWVPRGVTRRPVSQRGSSLLSRVSELIDPVSGEWDEGLVQQTFSQEDACEILRIPISEQGEDFIAWHFDSKGLFSVKSAYRVMIDHERRLLTRVLGESASGEDWKKETWWGLWQLNCPPRVHHFVWRLGHNSHPLLMNIERKGVETDTRCVVCKRLFEDGGHLFVNCKEVKWLWRALEMEAIRLQMDGCGNPLRIIQYVLTLPEDKQRLVVALLWCWWSERNKSNHSEKRMSTDELQFLVRRHAAEWKDLVHEKQPATITPVQKWHPPPEDYVMINCDGAFLAKNYGGGWGAVARDHEGDLIFAAAGHLNQAGQAMHAEAIAVRNAIQIADQMGIGRIIVATDCKNLITAITSQGYDSSILGQLFLEIKYMLQTSFIQCQVDFCPRVCNQVAHMLAAKGAGESHGFHAIWDVCYPDDVSRLVAGDLTEP